MALVGVFGAFMPAGFSWDFSDEQSGQAMGEALIDFTQSLAVMIIGVVGVIILAPKLPFIKKVSVATTIDATINEDVVHNLPKQEIGKRSAVSQQNAIPQVPCSSMVALIPPMPLIVRIYCQWYRSGSRRTRIW